MRSPTAGWSRRLGSADRTGRLADRVSALPLRTRMLVAMIALLAAVCLIVLSISLLLLRGFLISQLDIQLNGAGLRLAQSYGHSKPCSGDRGGAQSADRGGTPGDGTPGNGTPGPGTPGAGTPGGHVPGDRSPSDHTAGDHNAPCFLLSPGQRVGTLGARIVDGDVHQSGLLDGDGVLQTVGRHEENDLENVPTDGHPHTRAIGGIGDYRLIAVQRPDDSVLVTGLPLDEVNTTLVRLGWIELVVAAIGLIVAGAASTLIVRVTMRPLQRVAATAGRVAELRLDRGEVALAERVAPADTDPRTEVGQVGAALNRMLEHVASALEARQASETQLRQFLADASHELRTPLAAIRGYAELTRRSSEHVPPDVAHALSRVSSQAERMTSLVEDMLLLARLDAGRPLVREPVDVSQLVVDAVSDAHAAGPGHHWTLQLPDEAVTVPGDATRLSQVLSNLLANARVHTPPGTTVRAELTGGPAEAALRVVDDGPGIPPGLLPHVFGRFARGDSSRSRAAGSTGLGLAIAHAVVVAHGGQIGVQSVPGHTVFTVRLPTNGAPRITTPMPGVVAGRGSADGAGSGGGAGVGVGTVPVAVSVPSAVTVPASMPSSGPGSATGANGSGANGSGANGSGSNGTAQS
ncbi:MAG: two-component system, OmpR family, sensor kinase [Pseudonocardiales bacterium]|nr:two-component system, OmpR family, sensor kinase [Pseudonocardiales bacterium]